MHVLHHVHRRKHVTGGAKNGLFDKIIYVVAVVSPFMTLPQLYLVWVKRQTAGISIFTWSAYCFFNLVWIFYGLIHKDKPIVLCNFLWVVIQGLVVGGVYLYK